MVDDRRDTVVVEKDRSSSPLGWIIGIIILLALIILFFNYDGFGLFSGTEPAAPAGDAVNTETNIQAPAGQ